MRIPNISCKEGDDTNVNENDAKFTLKHINGCVPQDTPGIAEDAILSKHIISEAKI